MLKRHSCKSILFFLASLALMFGTESKAQTQFGIAPIQPDRVGDSITCRVGGSSYDLTPDKSLILATQFAPSNIETQKVFDDVARYANLYIKIYTIPVTNNINVQICPSDGGINYVAYSPSWLQRIYNETRNGWVLYAIIAHEIGHYALNHDRRSVGSNPQLELEADEYAGGILAKRGVSLPDAQAAYRSSTLASLVSHTHPEIAQRLDAVYRGWRKGGGTGPDAGGARVNPTQPESPRYNPPARGRKCTTTDGIHYKC